MIQLVRWLRVSCRSPTQRKKSQSRHPGSIWAIFIPAALQLLTVLTGNKHLVFSNIIYSWSNYIHDSAVSYKYRRLDCFTALIWIFVVCPMSDCGLQRTRFVQSVHTSNRDGKRCRYLTFNCFIFSFLDSIFIRQQ